MKRCVRAGYISRFLEDGRIEIDSNTVERSIRRIALNRKNALFAGSDVGASYCPFSDVLIKQGGFAADLEISGAAIAWRQLRDARHAYSGQAYLYEAPGPDTPVKHCSRWDRLTDRAVAIRQIRESRSSYSTEGDAV